MPILFTVGDLFEGNHDALVNPVNCMGVSGAGLAREFRNRFPVQQLKYESLCRRNGLNIGQIFVTKCPQIIYFPTKIHWNHSSKLEYIEQGLVALEVFLEKRNVRSIGIPALGCGLGSLKFKDVKPLFSQYLSSLVQEIVVYQSLA